MRNRHRFKLSDMMPHAWFYKLKDTNRRSSTAANQPSNNNNNNINRTNSPSLPSPTTTHQHHPTATSLPLDLNPRKSYHFPRELSPRLPDQPRRSSKQARPSSRKSKPKQAVASSPPVKPVSFSSASLSCRASSDSVWTRTEDADSPDSIFDSGSSPEFRLDRVLTPESDIIICVDENSFVGKPGRATGNRNLDAEPNFDLPRIITKPAKPRRGCNVGHVEAEDGETQKSPRKVREINGGGGGGSRQGASRRRSLTSSSPRPRLKIKSPRLAGRRPATQARRRGGVSSSSSGSSDSARRKLSGSFAVVKSSLDPKRDFRESMVEMIVEHNIKTTKDLEELLACYLSLNSEEYHELIIQVFQEIWFDLTDIINSVQAPLVNQGKVFR